MASNEAGNTSDFVIVGGGIAGVTCAEHLNILCPDKKVTLITCTDLVKSVVNLNQYGRKMEEFDVEEQTIDSLGKRLHNVSVVKGTVSSFDPKEHRVTTTEGVTFHYAKLCICTGGTPRLIEPHNQYVIGIRDNSSVQDLKKRLTSARRVAVVGNGGIALELVFELSGCEVLWAIKDDAIGNQFFDKGAATFLLPHLKTLDTKETVSKRMRYEIEENEAESKSQKGCVTSDKYGGALGPDWTTGLSLHSNSFPQDGVNAKNIHIEYKCEVEKIFSEEEYTNQNLQETFFPDSTKLCKWPAYVKLTNESIYGCDFVVSATGVSPNTNPFLSNVGFEIADDGGFKVDDNMKTNIPDVYAAGDVCTASWEASNLWFQMRLWSQARPMGAFAARCMNAHLQGEETSLDFCFELFAHVTKFFGFKVVLLGKFNAQGLGNDYQLLLRCTKGVEYVKVVLRNGRMVGAVLIGETDLDETFENLILNQLDLSEFGESLLDPRVDIDDFFD